MRETTWTPTSFAVVERADGRLALVLAEPYELVSVPPARGEAHRLGNELVKAAALTTEEIAQLDRPAVFQ